MWVWVCSGVLLLFLVLFSVNNLPYSGVVAVEGPDIRIGQVNGTHCYKKI